MLQYIPVFRNFLVIAREREAVARPGFPRLGANLLLFSTLSFFGKLHENERNGAGGGGENTPLDLSMRRITMKTQPKKMRMPNFDANYLGSV